MSKCQKNKKYDKVKICGEVLATYITDKMLCP